MTLSVIPQRRFYIILFTVRTNSPLTLGKVYREEDDFVFNFCKKISETGSLSCIQLQGSALEVKSCLPGFNALEPSWGAWLLGFDS